MYSPGFRYRLAPASLLAASIALLGCAGKGADNVVHVRGMVTYNGNPIPLGMIVFEPDPAKGNRGQQGHADIKNGQFDTRVSTKGAVVGPQVVRITGGDGVNPEPFTPFGNMLFEEHTVWVEVSKDKPELSFDVPRSGKKAK